MERIEELKKKIAELQEEIKVLEEVEIFKRLYEISLEYDEDKQAKIITFPKVPVDGFLNENWAFSILNGMEASIDCEGVKRNGVFPSLFLTDVNGKWFDFKGNEIKLPKGYLYFKPEQK